MTMFSPAQERRDWFRKQERKAVALLGLTDGEWFSWRDDMVAIEARGYFASKAGTGAVAKLINELDITSGATGSSYQDVFWDDGTASDLIVPGGTGGQWAIYGRLRFTGLDAETRCTFGARDAAGSNYIRIGCVGSVSAVNYVLQSDAASIDSGVVDDANLHDFFAIRVGTTTTFYIDGVVCGTPANLFPASDAGPHAVAVNAAAGGARKTGLSLVGITVPKKA